jgi:23S rRNA (uracil1939-C5)-methyltransferase
VSKKIKFYEIDDVAITDLSSEGKGIAKIDGKVIFVEKAVTGDIVNIQSKKTNKKFEEAKILQLLTSSQHRRDPYCSHFHKCGGCKTQHIDYAYQLQWKERVVRDALQRIGGFHDLEVLSIIGCEDVKYYRNKLDYAVSNRRWLSPAEVNSDEDFERSGIGFHLAGMYDKVLDIDTCYHMPAIHNDIRNFIRSKAREYEISFYDIIEKKGCLRNILMRKNVKDEWMICFQIYEEDEQFMNLLNDIKNEFPQIISLQYTINPKSNDTIYDLDFQVHHGQDFIYEYLGEKKFKITPKSFFQTNTTQCVRLYDLIGDMADIQEDNIVYDLYCGVGSIGIYLAEKAKKIIGIELVEEAIHDAKMNAKINGMEHCEYYAADMRTIFSTEFIQKSGAPDIIIVDPPRAGMHPDVVEQLSQSRAPKIVYVSCNPQTMANDLKVLSNQYNIQKVQPVDMFPNTIHIEAITLLTLK